MKIILTASEGSQQTFILGKKNLIGRAKNSTVHLTGDDQVSRKHAAIIKKGNTYWLTDLGSNNGTYINGSRIDSHHRLHDHDTIVIGRSSFTVQLNEPVSTEGDLDDEATVFGEPTPEMNQQLFEELDEQTQFMSPETIEELYEGYELHIIKGAREGDSFILHNKETSIGRDLDNDVCLPCTSVSSKHAQITRQQQNYFINDLGSTNGTFVNKTKLGKKTQLHTGDIIQIGDVKMQFGSESTEESAPVNLVGTQQKKGNKTLLIFAVLILVGISLFFAFWLEKTPTIKKESVVSGKKQTVESLKTVVKDETPPSPQKTKKDTESVKAPTIATQPEVKKSPPPPSTAELQERANSVIADSIKMYIDGDITKALQNLERVYALPLAGDDAVRMQGERVTFKVKECSKHYQDGHQSFLSGDIDKAVEKWNKVLPCEAAFIDHSLQEKSLISKNISTMMAEELYMQVLKLVEEKNLVMAKQYCIEVLKAIPQHRGCSEIMKNSSQ